MSYFIAGTDTGVGKTRVTLGLLTALQAAGLDACGMKPVASGCLEVDGGLKNDDALGILACSKGGVEYDVVNPYAFAPPIAPSFAAEMAGEIIQPTRIENCFREISAKADIVLVEGAGGWRLPLNAGVQLAEVVKSLDLSVILVVGFRLGCINHALLTAEAIHRDGVKLAAWVGNCIDPEYGEVTRTREYLKSALPAPMMGCLPYGKDAGLAEIASRLNLRQLRLDIDIKRNVSHTGLA